MATLSLEAVQWKPGVEIPGVFEEKKIAKSGDPEVTHGLVLIPGLAPFKLVDADGKETKAAVGTEISAGRAHFDTPEGHTLLLRPGDWLVKVGSKSEVWTNEEFVAAQK